MNNVAKYIQNVKSVENFQRKIKIRKDREGSLYASKKHQATADDMKEVAAFLESLPVDEEGNYAPLSNTPNNPASQGCQPDLFTVSESDIENMPPKVKEALSLTEADELEAKIIELLRIAGRPLNITELIIGLFKKYSYEVTERNPFAAKLYRITKAGGIASVSGKKGYYTLPTSSDNSES